MFGLRHQSLHFQETGPGLYGTDEEALWSGYVVLVLGYTHWHYFCSFLDAAYFKIDQDWGIV